jgi:hypothetical protein
MNAMRNKKARLCKAAVINAHCCITCVAHRQYLSNGEVYAFHGHQSANIIQKAQTIFHVVAHSAAVS